MDVMMLNGTCYETGPDGTTMKFIGLYDKKLAALFNIRPVIPSEEYFM